MTVSLATAVMAQHDEAQSKKKRHKGNQPEAAQEAAQPAPNPARPAKNMPQPGKSRAAGKAHHGQAPVTATDATTNPRGSMPPDGKRHNKQMKKPQPDAAPTTAIRKPVAPAATERKTETSASTAANQPPRKRNAKARKPDPQVVQKVKTEHVNFKARPKPNKVPTVTYNESYRMTGAQQWQGSQYEVFRTYRPQRHDERWYRSRYPRVEIIAGGAYYFNNGFWFPAWGYNPSYQVLCL